MITIEENSYGDNTCFVCMQPYKHIRYWEKDSNVGLYEMKLCVVHPSCKRLMNKIHQKQKEMLNLEFELFCKKFQIDDDYMPHIEASTR